MSDRDVRLETAFDGSVTDVERLRATLTGSDLRDFDDMVQIRTDLKALRDVPECQLTVDHLRSAVLGRTQRKSPSLGPWLVWTPVAAAAAFAVMLFNRPAAAPNPAKPSPDVATTVGAAPALQPPVEETLSTKDELTSQPTTGAEDRAAETVVAKAAPTLAAKSALRRSLSPRRDSRRSALSSARDTVTTTVPTVPVASGPTAESGMATVAAMQPQPEPVVVVTETSNPDTGAAEAREVSRPSDVVFGG